MSNDQFVVEKKHLVGFGDQDLVNVAKDLKREVGPDDNRERVEGLVLEGLADTSVHHATRKSVTGKIQESYEAYEKAQSKSEGPGAGADTEEGNAAQAGIVADDGKNSTGQLTPAASEATAEELNRTVGEQTLAEAEARADQAKAEEKSDKWYRFTPKSGQQLNFGGFVIPADGMRALEGSVTYSRLMSFGTHHLNREEDKDETK